MLQYSEKMLKNVLNLSPINARKFFISQEAYSNMELPPYFVFNKILLDIENVFSEEMKMRDICWKIKI